MPKKKANFLYSDFPLLLIWYVWMFTLYKNEKKKKKKKKKSIVLQFVLGSHAIWLD